MSGSQTGGGVKSQSGFMPGGGFGTTPGYSLTGQPAMPAPMAADNAAFQSPMQSPIRPMEGVGQVNQGKVDYMNQYQPMNGPPGVDQGGLPRMGGPEVRGPEMGNMQPQNGLLGMTDEMMRRRSDYRG
jgi:hypothetical protein